MYIFATSHYEYLQQEMLTLSKGFEGKIERKTFPDGEKYYRIQTDVQQQDVLLIGGTVSDSETLELYDLGYGLVQLGARKLSLVIPYFGYSTMERAVRQGEIVTAKTRAKLFSSIPRASYGNEVILIDLHSEGIPHYFGENMRSYHLYAKPIVMEMARKLAGNHFVLASTDAGRAKWVESLANDMQVEAAFVYKRRLSGSETQVTGVNADVKGKTVVLYDDMIRTGGSLLQAAKAYKEAGASAIYVLATHGIFPLQAVEKIQQSGLVEKIAVTNTHPNALALQSDFLEVTSIAPLVVQGLHF